MNAVIKQLQDEDKAQLEADQRLYADLLENDTPTPTEVDELRQLMKRLGKTPEQLQLDHRIIRDAQAAEQRIREGTSLDEQIAVAERAKNAFYEETCAIKTQREREADLLSLKSSQIQHKKYAAQDSHYNLEKMKHLHPDLLRHRPALPKP